MNFLKKAKEQVNSESTTTIEATKPTIPGRPNIPGSKPSVPGSKPSVPGARPNIPGAKPNIPGSKPNIPGAKPSIPTKVVVPEVEINTSEIVEETTAPLAAKSNPFVKKGLKEEAKEVVVPEVEEISIPEPEPEVPEIEEEVKIIETEEVNTPLEEGKEEEKPKGKKKGSRRKKAVEAQEKEDKAEESIKECEAPVITITKTELDYAEAMESIGSSFVDEEWENFRADVTQRLNDINISSDMNSVALRNTIAELSSLRESIWVIYNDTKTQYETLTAKEPEGLIERIKKLNSRGSNDSERKYNAIMAVTNFKNDDGKKINLYELLDETRERFNFLKSLMDTSQYKTNILVTMLGGLKLDR